MTTSMGCLLDRHVLLWWWFDPQKLPEGVLALLSDAETPVVVSSASIWELSIKHHLGKLPELQPAITDLPALLRADGFQILSIAINHALRAGAYFQAHRVHSIACSLLKQSSSSLCWSRTIRNSRPSLAAGFGRVDQRVG